MLFEQFICGECGLIEKTERLNEVIIDSESKVPEDAKGIGKILVRNKYRGYSCPECASYMLFYAKPRNHDAKLEYESTNQNIEPAKESLNTEDTKVVQVQQKRGRKPKKSIIESLEVANNVNGTDDDKKRFIESELEALTELSRSSGLKVDTDKAYEALKNKFENKQPRITRPPPRMRKFECDTCNKMFESKFEATRCRSCINRTPINR